MVHCHAVHLPLGALLVPCTVCGTGGYTYYLIWQVLITPLAVLSKVERVTPALDNIGPDAAAAAAATAAPAVAAAAAAAAVGVVRGGVGQAWLNLVWAMTHCFIVAFNFVAMIDVSVELEDPFGVDPNDLPLLAMHDELNQVWSTAYPSPYTYTRIVYTCMHLTSPCIHSYCRRGSSASSPSPPLHPPSHR